jgi:hypothetical protein
MLNIELKKIAVCIAVVVLICGLYLFIIHDNMTGKYNKPQNPNSYQPVNKLLSCMALGNNKQYKRIG